MYLGRSGTPRWVLSTHCASGPITFPTFRDHKNPPARKIHRLEIVPKDCMMCLSFSTLFHLRSIFSHNDLPCLQDTAQSRNRDLLDNSPRIEKSNLHFPDAGQIFVRLSNDHSVLFSNHQVPTSLVPNSTFHHIAVH